MSTICILNLSRPRIEPVPFSFAGDVLKIEDPQLIPDQGALILYVVAHGVPDGFLTGDAQPPLIGERELFAAIRARRDEKSDTLIVWDLCFAKSFFSIPGLAWPKNYAHLFACEAHERTWHTGPRTGGLAPQSVFSAQLERAILTCKQDHRLSWAGIDQTLKALLGPAQTPSVVPSGVPVLFFGA